MEIVLSKNNVSSLRLKISSLRECTNNKVWLARIINTRKCEYIMFEHYETGFVVILNLHCFIRYGVCEVKNLFGQVLGDIGISREVTCKFLDTCGDVEYVLPNFDFTEDVLLRNDFQIDYEYFMTDLGNKKLIQREASKYLNTLSKDHMFGVTALIINNVKTRL